MNGLGQRIVALIRAQGPISVAEYMTLALHDSSSGYYATRDRLGAKGDFLTAPEISQMFGELAGLWLAQIWRDQDTPSLPLLVELGPGRGTLMADVLRALRLVPELRNTLEVVLVEISPVLRRVQEEKLCDCGIDVHWVTSLEGIAKDRPLFLLANEFFDALPLRQYVKSKRGWCERMVTIDPEGELTFALAPMALPLPHAAQSAPLGSVFETCAGGQALIQDIAQRISANGGAALIVDYGYGAKTGSAETLQSIKSHAFAQLLKDPGENDLSAHVDFEALARSVSLGGAVCFGPVPQNHFLKALGICQRANTLAKANPALKPLLDGQLERLTNADQMGQLFKVLAILPTQAPRPPGF